MSSRATDRSRKACVVLVHGLWMNGMELTLLRHRVARCGYDTARFTYPTVSAGVADNAARLWRFLDGIDATTLNLIGHSLGGLVILQMLQQFPDTRISRAVLLGSPLAGSGAARRLAQTAFGRRILGNSLGGGLAGMQSAVNGVCEVGVIAGCSSVGLGRVVGGVASPSDGTVAVAETRIDGLADHLVLPVSHSGLVLSGRVASEVCHFLHHGRFAERRV